MTTSITPADQDVKDFSSHKDVRFNINHADGTPEMFVGLPELPAMLMVELAVGLEQLNTSDAKDQPKVFNDLFQVVLEDDSSERLIDRMHSKSDPVGIKQLTDILQWIMEQYGLRPTQPSSDSSAGSESPDGGTSSTADAPAPESTSDDSPPTASST